VAASNAPSRLTPHTLTTTNTDSRPMTTTTRTTRSKTNADAAQEPDFLQQMEALLAATNAQLAETGTAKRSTASGPKLNPVWEALEPLTQAALTRAGITHTNNLLIEREGDERAPMRNRPTRMTATAGRCGDAWATQRNKLRHLFILSAIATAAGNKGRIALSDVACLYVAFNLAQFENGSANDLNSVAKIAAALFTRLNRPVEVSGEILEVKGLQPDPALAQWVAPANAQITRVKGLIRSEA